MRIPYKTTIEYIFQKTLQESFGSYAGFRGEALLLDDVIPARRVWTTGEQHECSQELAGPPGNKGVALYLLPLFFDLHSIKSVKNWFQLNLANLNSHVRDEKKRQKFLCPQPSSCTRDLETLCEFSNWLPVSPSQKTKCLHNILYFRQVERQIRYGVQRHVWDT